MSQWRWSFSASKDNTEVSKQECEEYFKHVVSPDFIIKEHSLKTQVKYKLCPDKVWSKINEFLKNNDSCILKFCHSFPTPCHTLQRQRFKELIFYVIKKYFSDI